MIQEKGERVLTKMEKSLGRYALPQILRWVAGFQVFSWALSLFSPEFLQYIEFDRNAILAGEVWRLFSWALMPRAENFLIVLIAALFLFFINDALERHWDSFRLNVYVVATILILTLVGLIPNAAGVGGILNLVFYSSTFLAFASLFPDHVIHLFAVIPIKAKWLGWANAAALLGITLTSPSLLIVGGIVVVGLLPYFLVFLPGFITAFKESGEASIRRRKFESSNSGEEEPFHECDRCGATDRTHPNREFRVTADGSELCEDCRNRDAGASVD